MGGKGSSEGFGAFLAVMQSDIDKYVEERAALTVMGRAAVKAKGGLPGRIITKRKTLFRCRAMNRSNRHGGVRALFGKVKPQCLNLRVGGEGDDLLRDLKG